MDSWWRFPQQRDDFPVVPGGPSSVPNAHDATLGQRLNELDANPDAS